MDIYRDEFQEESFDWKKVFNQTYPATKLPPQKKWDGAIYKWSNVVKEESRVREYPDVSDEEEDKEDAKHFQWYKNTPPTLSISPYYFGKPDTQKTEPLPPPEESRSCFDWLKEGIACTNDVFAVIPTDLGTFHILCENYAVYCASNIDDLEDFAKKKEDEAWYSNLDNPMPLTEETWYRYVEEE
jgi:hypothetical protein